MRLDRFSNPIYNEQDIFRALYQGHTDILKRATVDPSPEIEKLSTLSHTHLLTPIELDDSFSIADYDHAMQKDWFMPKDSCPNLVEMLYAKCTNDEQANRVSEELEAFIKHGMMDLLYYLKYLVDTLEEKNILWGVGRGSSVASYVLYLIGVHSIDSMKYNLDWREFLR
jgi:DNA polymerase III alpha subunit